MKILHVSEYYGAGWGAEDYIENACGALEAHGHQNVVVYGTATSAQLSEARPRFWVPGIAAFDIRRSREPIKAVLKLVDEEQPDLIQFHQMDHPEVAAALALVKPCVRFVHNHALTCPGGERYWRTSDAICTLHTGACCIRNAFLEGCMSRRPARLTFQFARTYQGMKTARRHLRKLIVASKFMRSTLLDAGFDPSLVAVVPLLTRIPPEVPSHPAEGSLLYVGRLTAEKGLGQLLDAVGRVRNPWRLIVCGEGALRPWLERSVAKRGWADRVKFTGWVTKEDLGRFYEMASVVVIPSVWPEPFGLVGLEAMAQGRPVVAFAVGGIPEWLEHGETGFLVPPGDIAGFADQIERLLRDPALARRLGLEGRRRVEAQYSPEVHTKRLVQVYEEVLSVRKTAVAGSAACGF